MSPDNIHIVVYTPQDRRLRVADREGKIHATSSSVLNEVASIAVSPDGTRVAVRSAVGVELFELMSLQRLLTIPIPEPQPAPGSGVLRFSTDGSRIVMVEKGRVRVFEAQSSYDAQVRRLVRETPGEPSGRYSRPTPSWVYDVERQIEGDPLIGPDIRRAVVAEFRRIGDRDVAALCNYSAVIVLRSDAPPDEYRRAVRNATRAAELAPWIRFCVGIKGMALYRVQDYEGALIALDRAKATEGDPRSAEFAFRAMALRKLGRTVEASDASEEFRRTVDESDESLRALGAEVKFLVPPSRRPPQ